MDASVAHVLQPTWVANPDAWVWKRPDGQLQGPGLCWRSDPGAFNLTWLAMDMVAPPQVYDLTRNLLYYHLLMFSPSTTLGQRRLRDVFELCTLRQFVRRLDEQVLHGALASMKPLIKLCAERRLHAHT